MIGALCSLASAIMQNRSMMQAQERYQQEARDAYDRMALIGRTFKCGPWRWKIVAAHTDDLGRPLTPEIKAVFFS